MYMIETYKHGAFLCKHKTYKLPKEQRLTHPAVFESRLLTAGEFKTQKMEHLDKKETKKKTYQLLDDVF